MVILNILVTLAIGTGVIIPQSNPEGKRLTMEEATIKQSSVRPQKVNLPIHPRVHSPFSQKDGTLYYGETPVAAAHDAVTFGTSVSRNEFGCTKGIFPSPDPKKCAFYQKDESAVGTFSLLDIDTASAKEIRYPFNGTPSEKLKLMVYNASTGVTTEIRIDDFDDERYITQVCWRDDNTLLVQVLDRSQHNMRLNMYDASTGKFIKTILRESNSAWVEPYDMPHFINSDVFIYSTDNRDGYKNLYLCDLDGHIRRLVRTNADIRWQYYDGRYVYYTSAEISPADNHLFRVRLRCGRDPIKARIGKPVRLTQESGWHDISFYDDYYIDRFSSFDNPGYTKSYYLNGRLKETFIECGDPLKDYAVPEMEFGSIPSADGKYENHYRLIKPLNFDPDKKYPLIVYVYGGPHSQLVNNSWRGNIRMWEMLMAQKGYIVYVQDNRGTENHGADYEKAINRRCGQAEMQDQMVGIRMLLAMPWVDKDRVGIHGWSYGGFMTISLKLAHPDIFKVAVAGGPVIDWKWYEIMYGERYMDTVGTNPEGFEETSLLNKAKFLDGKLLICQGAIDDTVVWQHSLSFVQACINAGKQVDYFPFPKAYHNMTGMERVYLYDKITEYFDTNL